MTLTLLHNKGSNHNKITLSLPSRANVCGGSQRHTEAMGVSWTRGSDLLGEWGTQVFNPISGFIEFYPDGVRPELRPRGLDRQGRDRLLGEVNPECKIPALWTWACSRLSSSESQLFHTGQFSLQAWPCVTMGVCFLVCAPWLTWAKCGPLTARLFIFQSLELGIE